MKSTLRSLPANIIQAHDGHLARYLIKHLNIFTIHDSFGISIFDVHLLMDYTNEYFQKELGISYNSYSYFILL